VSGRARCRGRAGPFCSCRSRGDAVAQSRARRWPTPPALYAGSPAGRSLGIAILQMLQTRYQDGAYANSPARGSQAANPAVSQYLKPSHGATSGPRLQGVVMLNATVLSSTTPCCESAQSYSCSPFGWCCSCAGCRGRRSPTPRRRRRLTACRFRAAAQEPASARKRLGAYACGTHRAADLGCDCGDLSLCRSRRTDARPSPTSLAAECRSVQSRCQRRQVFDTCDTGEVPVTGRGRQAAESSAQVSRRALGCIGLANPRRVIGTEFLFGRPSARAVRGRFDAGRYALVETDWFATGRSPIVMPPTQLGGNRLAPSARFVLARSRNSILPACIRRPRLPVPWTARSC